MASRRTSASEEDFDGSSSTYRHHNTPDFEGAGIIGVDTIAFRGPVHPDTLTALPRQRLRRDVDLGTGVVIETNTSAQATLAAAVVFRVDTWRGKPEAYMECSLPTLLRGDNTIAVPVEAVPTMVTRLWEEGAVHMQWQCSPDELTLMRLDLVRDFVAVDRLQGLLREIAEVPAVRAETHVHKTRDCSGVETLIRETQRWRARLYDREVSYLNRARSRKADDADRRRALAVQNRGRLRYELQLRSPALTTLRLSALQDLTAPTAEQLARDFFSRCRFDAPVGDIWLKFRRAVNELELGGRGSEARGMCGQLSIDGLGEPWKDVTSLKYRKLAQDYALFPGEVTAPRGTGLRRLDFDRGLICA